MNHLLGRFLLVAALCLPVSCTSVVTQPDGSVVQQAVDLDLVRLMASASVASWAAATNGISEKDANAVSTIMDQLLAFHSDGTPIEPAAWTKAIQRDVPKRYQGLAIVLVEITAYQLKKQGLESVVPAPDSVAWKILDAIHEGARLGLAPYMHQSPA